MNKFLSEVLEEHSPNFNHDITSGLAKKFIPGAPDYIDSIIRSSMRSAPAALEYHGYRRLTPREEYNSLFTTPDMKIAYDTAKSDIYKVELLFTYKGVKLPRRYIYLPFVGDAGIMHISDTKYHIVPVLSDTVVSPSHKEVFVRLLRDKLIFKRVNRNIIKNGEKVSGQVIHSSIYRTNGRNIKDALGGIVTPVSLYLVAKLGFMETFRKYVGGTPIITDIPNPAEVYPGYVVYESTKLKPRSLKDMHYVSHDVKILVPESCKSTSLIDSLVAGLIYVLDVFPDTANEMMDVVKANDITREIMYWRILLGKIVFKNSYSVDRAHADMNDHFASLESYIDSLIKEKLAETGIHVDDFFDLLAVILGEYNDWLLHSKEYSSNVYNRYLDILYYLLYDIILGINRTIFELSRKSVKKELGEQEVLRIFNKHLSPRKIYQIVKASGMNISLMLVDYTGDNMYPKITSILELQERGNGVQRGIQSGFPESTRTLSGHDLFLGSLLFLPKKSPTPRVRINPFTKIDLTSGRLIPDEATRETLNLLDTMLAGRTEDNEKIKELELGVDLEDIAVD